MFRAGVYPMALPFVGSVEGAGEIVEVGPDAAEVFGLWQQGVLGDIEFHRYPLAAPNSPPVPQVPEPAIGREKPTAGRNGTYKSAAETRTETRTRQTPYGKYGEQSDRYE